MSTTRQKIDGVLRVTLDLRAYRLIAIKKAAYRFADRCAVVVASATDTSAELAVTFPAGSPPEREEATLGAFFQELLDQELREHVAEETAPLRTLILAQAFSRTDLVRRSG